MTNATSKRVATMETKDGKPLRTKHNIKNLKKYNTRERDGDLNNHCVEITKSSDNESRVFVPVDYKWQQIVTNEILGLEIAKSHRKRKIVKELNKSSNLIVMKGDGNCFFRAITFAVTGCQSKYTTIRNFIVSWMGNNNAKIENFFGSNYRNESNMSSDGVWATEAEILSSAAVLKTYIFIYCESGQAMKWLIYTASTLGKNHVKTNVFIWTIRVGL